MSEAVPPRLPSLLNITLSDISKGLDAGDFTSVDLVEAYQRRVDETNLRLRAVLEINPDALAIARELDDERLSRGRGGPLHGVPILIKDNIATLDNLNTTSGSFALLRAKPLRDAKVVTALRQAGAIILGKSNLSQWANFRRNNGSDGWSARGGQTVGPYHPEQDPGGSSSGSAGGVSVGLAFAALGTETDGSIICPAAYNGVVGIKPTIGLTSRHLVLPGSPRQDSVGPIARRVKDAASILSIIAGNDDFNDMTSRIPFNTIPDYTAERKADALAGARIGVPRNAIQGSEAELREFENGIQTMLSAGATIIDPVDIPSFRDFTHLDTEKIIMAEFAAGLSEYFKSLETNPLNMRDLDDLIQYTQQAFSEQYPSYDVGRLEDAKSSPPPSTAEYQENLARATYLSDQQGLLACLNEFDLDAVILPEASKKATSLAGIGGFPVVTIPLGKFPEGTSIKRNSRGNLVRAASGIPFGLQIMGHHFDEQKLIGLAYAYE